MKHTTFISFITIFLFIFTASPAFSATITRNLRQGDRGQDVVTLQKLLNSNPATAISTFGVGSSGQETTYFGAKTTLAVIKFQKLYGISPAVGYVGPVTRQKMASLEGEIVYATPTPTPFPTQTAQITSSTSPAHDLIEFYSRFSDTVDKTPLIFAISEAQVAPGGTLILYGSNLGSKNSHIFIGQTEITPTFNAPTGASSTITIPSSISTGVYDLWTQSGTGTTTKKFMLKFEVTNSPTKRPILYSSTPLMVTLNDTIVVSGANFSSYDNAITSGFGIIKGLSSSDGKTLSFRVRDFAGAVKASQDPKLIGNEVPMSFLVKTSGGLSNQSGLFYIKF